MLGHRTRIVARRGLVIGVAGVVASLLGAGIASADVGVNQFLSWSGNFPIIGTLDPIVTDTVATIPSPVTVGQVSASFPVSVTIDAPPLATTGLETVGAASTSGTADVTVQSTDSAGLTTTEDVQLTIPPTATPADGSDFVVTATGTATVPGQRHAHRALPRVHNAHPGRRERQSDGSGDVHRHPDTGRHRAVTESHQ